MTKQQLKFALKILKKFKDERDKLSDTMAKLGKGTSFFLDYDDRLEEDFINFLDALTNKRQWIAWFVYENDFGKKELRGGAAGDTKPIKTADDLWKLIQSEKE